MSMAYGFKATALKSANSARLLRIAYPTGCCIQELAVNIHTAEPVEAKATSHMTDACAFLDSFSQPNIHTPIMVDSRKKKPKASMANKDPKMSPMNSEYLDQLVPNWNSSVMPVTTPMAKLMRKSLPQNLVILRYISSPVRAYLVSIRAIITDSPSVSGTNRK